MSTITNNKQARAEQATIAVMPSIEWFAGLPGDRRSKAIRATKLYAMTQSENRDGFEEMLRGKLADVYGHPTETAVAEDDAIVEMMAKTPEYLWIALQGLAEDYRKDALTRLGKAADMVCPDVVGGLRKEFEGWQWSYFWPSMTSPDEAGKAAFARVCEQRKGDPNAKMSANRAYREAAASAKRNIQRYEDEMHRSGLFEPEGAQRLIWEAAVSDPDMTDETIKALRDRYKIAARAGYIAKAIDAFVERDY